MAGAGGGIGDVGGASKDWECHKEAGAGQKKGGARHRDRLERFEGNDKSGRFLARVGVR